MVLRKAFLNVNWCNAQYHLYEVQGSTPRIFSLAPTQRSCNKINKIVFVVVFDP